MGRRYDFKYQSLQDTETIVQYLEALADGLRKGDLTLAKEDRAINLKPHGLIRLGIAAGTGDLRSRILIQLSWRNADTTVGARDSRLRIEGSAGGDA
jgi:amphi-Trp domain-containing protein